MNQKTEKISMEGPMKLHTNHNPSSLASEESFNSGLFVSAPAAQFAPKHRENCNPAMVSPMISPRKLFCTLLTLAALIVVAAGAHAQSAFAKSNVGAAVTQAVTVTASAAGSVSNVEVLTRGATGEDFTPGSGSASPSCSTATLSVNGTCQVSVTFTPQYPGLRIGAVVLLDAGKKVLGTAFLSGIGVGGLDVLTPGNVITVAGVYRAWTSTRNGIPATIANIDQPSGIAFDGAGNLYIADSLHNQVRMVCAAAGSATISGTTCSGAGIITLVAGTGVAGSSGDNGNAVTSTLNLPGGVTIDGAGNLYIADTGNNKIRVVARSTGTISTAAGNGQIGNSDADAVGDNGPAIDGNLNQPQGITLDAAGNLFIADTANQRIRRVDAVTAVITTAAGNGKSSGVGDGKGTYSGDTAAATAAGLSLPYTVAFDSMGNMLIPDSANNRVRAVQAVGGAITPASIITTAVGTAQSGASCPAAVMATNEVQLNTPSGVAVDPADNVYIADTQDSCIRKANVTLNTTTSIVTNGETAISPANNKTTASVYAPVGLIVDGLGNVFYSDYYFMLVNEIQSNKAVLDFTATAVLEGEQSATSLPQIVENDGNASASLTSVKPDINAAVDATTTTCGPAFPFTVAQDNDCVVGALFAPSTTGNPLLGNIYVAGNTVNDDNSKEPLDIVLIGDSSQFTITLTSSPNPSGFGSSVTFQASVNDGTGTATGTVVFSDSLNGAAATTLGSVNLSNGEANFSTTALAVGVHTITATYGADSSTATVTQTVYEGTKTAIAALPASPSTLGTPVVFTATVSGPAGGGQTLAGTVTFTDSAATFTNNTVAITTSGVTGTASYTANALPQGVNTITATFTPANPTLVYPSTGTLSQDVQGASTFTVTSAPNPTTYGSAVIFAVTVPNAGTVAATGNVKIVITLVGATTPTYTLNAGLAGSPAAATASISSLPVGSYNATATYSGDANYSASTATLATPEMVNQVTTTTTAIALPSPGIAGKPVAITATVTPASGSVKPTGTATFADTFNGATTTLGAGAITLTQAGTATINPTLAGGTHSILVSYSGDANDAKSSFTLSLIVGLATTTTTVTATPNPANVQATITFSATVTGIGPTPTGTVNFLANGTIALGTGTLDASGKTTVTYSKLPAGSYQITAVYAGDTDSATSTSAAIAEVVGLLPTITDLSFASTTGANSQSILVSTVQNNNVTGPAPTGTVTFKNGTTTVGTAALNNDGVATLTPNLGGGTYNIIAYYPGDTLHAASHSAAVTINSSGSSYTLTVTPGTVSIPTTQNTTVTIGLSSISGFADIVGIGCASLPAGVNCHFSNISVPLTANGKATAQLTIDTNNPLGGGASAMNRLPQNRNMEMAGLFLPFSLLMGWAMWRFRKRHSSIWSMVLLLVLSGAALMASGCGGFTQTSAAAGTYTFQVVGVGANSNVTEYQNVTLTITQ
jgi:large repetitive protein